MMSFPKGFFIDFINYLKGNGELLPEVKPVEDWEKFRLGGFISDELITETALCRGIEAAYNLKVEESKRFLDGYIKFIDDKE
jgi:hypothetical protein